MSSPPAAGRPGIARGCSPLAIPEHDPGGGVQIAELLQQARDDVSQAVDLLYYPQDSPSIVIPLERALVAITEAQRLAKR